tara:strand:+ start:73 stop:585 length:513 start_codon:yes stop_codon:yes gene_type:complete
MYYSFRKDKSVGELGERIVVEDLLSCGFKFINDNKNNRYDIKMMNKDGKLLYFEVKTDVWCIPSKKIEAPFGVITIPPRDNGNMFIEVECRGKPSGLLTTISNYFVTYYPYYKEIWYISVDKLKKLINDNDFIKTEESGDVNSNTKGYLINRFDYRDFFKIRITSHIWED